MIVGYQGEHGAYSEEAAHNFFNDISTKTFDCFDDVLQALNNGIIDRAIIPTYNTIGGIVNDAQLALHKHRHDKVTSFYFRIEHNLLAYPDQKIEEINQVISHPQAIKQCSETLDSMGFATKEYYDTAGAAKYIHTEQLRHTGALASSRASKVYNLEILKHNMEDKAKNYTHFAVLQ